MCGFGRLLAKEGLVLILFHGSILCGTSSGALFGVLYNTSCVVYRGCGVLVVHIELPWDLLMILATFCSNCKGKKTRFSNQCLRRGFFQKMAFSESDIGKNESLSGVENNSMHSGIAVIVHLFEELSGYTQG